MGKKKLVPKIKKHKFERSTFLQDITNRKRGPIAHIDDGLLLWKLLRPHLIEELQKESDAFNTAKEKQASTFKEWVSLCSREIVFKDAVEEMWEEVLDEVPAPIAELIQYQLSEKFPQEKKEVSQECFKASQHSLQLAESIQSLQLLIQSTVKVIPQ